MEMSRKHVAIITGGPSSEREISLKSAKTVFKHLDRARYVPRLILLDGSAFIDDLSGQKLDLNGFTCSQDGEKIFFDVVFFMIHGHPAEDGQLQGYFDLMGIPYTGCSGFVSALTFNKQAAKSYLLDRIPMAQSQLLRQGLPFDLAGWSFPVFVKPNKNGSSFGASKVDQRAALPQALDKAFKFDDEVLVETYLSGRELTNGVFRNNGKITVLPVTEIRTENSFFDYGAKYLKESEEITPAPLSDAQTERCKDYSKMLYETLGCKGIVRFDYILRDDRYYFLEANTIPGMSDESIIPQQVNALGWELKDFFSALIEEALEVRND